MEFGLLWEFNSSHFERESDLTSLFEKNIIVLGINPYGLVARIAGFHPADSGSIAGMENFHNIFSWYSLSSSVVLCFHDLHAQVSMEY